MSDFLIQDRIKCPHCGMDFDVYVGHKPLRWKEVREALARGEKIQWRHKNNYGSSNGWNPWEDNGGFYYSGEPIDWAREESKESCFTEWRIKP